MRPLVAVLFTVAVGATVLAGDGLVLVPHSHALGTPSDHPHGLALYRFPVALLGGPADAPSTLPARSSTVTIRMAGPLSETLAGMSLLLLAAVVVLAVAAAHSLARHFVLLADVHAPQWSALTPTGPPRFLPIV